MDNEILIRERVQVIARFNESRTICEPVRFKRANGWEVEVTEIGLRHPTFQGQRTIHIFDVTDGEADYRLEFDSERLVWWLTSEGDHSMNCEAEL